MADKIIHNKAILDAFEVLKLEFGKQTGKKIKSIQSIKFTIQHPAKDKDPNSKEKDTKHEIGSPMSPIKETDPDFLHGIDYFCYNTTTGMECD